MATAQQQQLGKTLWGIADKLHGAINDELICTQSRKLETLEAHKEGMIRQMFPTMSDFARRAFISIENKMGKFSWQEGFGAFSYGKSQIPDIAKYIATQEIHHKKQTFIGEYLNFLNLFEIEYDERYVFKPIE
jgi:hypothetical protein